MTVQPQQPQQPMSVAKTIAHYAPMIAEALPHQIGIERFQRLALTTLRKDPALQLCKPESFVGALLTAAALGLEPGVNGEAYLVAYKKECTLIVGYQGLAKLFWQHPLGARLSAEYVCQNDEFSYSKGTNPHIHHQPALGERGPIIAYYAIVGLRNGAEWFDVFTPKQISDLRGPNVRAGQIRDPEHWMARKTALKQVLKLAPKSTAMQQIMAVDEQPGSITTAQQVAAAATPAGDDKGRNFDPETGEIYEGEVVYDPSQVDPWADQIADGVA